ARLFPIDKSRHSCRFSPCHRQANNAIPEMSHSASSRKAQVLSVGIGAAEADAARAVEKTSPRNVKLRHYPGESKPAVYYARYLFYYTGYHGKARRISAGRLGCRAQLGRA